MNCINNEVAATSFFESKGVSNQASDEAVAHAPTPRDKRSNIVDHLPKYTLALVNARTMPATVINAAEVIIIPVINSSGYCITASFNRVVAIIGGMSGKINVRELSR